MDSAQVEATKTGSVMDGLSAKVVKVRDPSGCTGPRQSVGNAVGGVIPAGLVCRGCGGPVGFVNNGKHQS